MRLVHLVAFASLTFTTLTYQGFAADLKITVAGAKPATSQFIVSAFGNEGTWIMPPRTYGVAIVHDANAVGRINTNALGISLDKLPVSPFWLTLAGLLLMSLASIIQVFAPTRKAASLFTTLVMFPLLLVGGSFFPFENMPGFLANIGKRPCILCISRTVSRVGWSQPGRGWGYRHVSGDDHGGLGHGGPSKLPRVGCSLCKKLSRQAGRWIRSTGSQVVVMRRALSCLILQH